MKTCVDIAAHLKRAGGYLELRYDEKAGTFLVQDGYRIQRSKYLDDALENLAEEKRRTDAKMEPMRDRPVEQKKPTVSNQPISMTISFNGNQIASTVSKLSAQYPTCPKCGGYPGYGYPISATRHSWTCSSCSHAWDHQKYDGHIVRLKYLGRIIEFVSDAIGVYNEVKP